MAEAIGVILLGVGIGALGLVQADMYVVGLVVITIGLVGVLVRLVYGWLDRRSTVTS
ncbi:hypothetical protein [Amycolatopsis taiwanensis]|uniref:Uncharacterized protein n=1 Tax=Amycolatopsis taiwanensis TaxID=342230 RepID=A0A9W6R2A8_9PSEU|nr:hypothetical protein [Amycolatopsis taiwanensis]GLY67153.1 hypothetical protein Atai01_37720 [Amycolatopsis taiwanensis]